MKKIWFLVFFFGSLYSLFSLIPHFTFRTFAFDLGIYDQIIWLASHGLPLFSSILDYHPWGDHLTPSLLVLVPLYWVWDGAAILLLFQAFFAAFGALPIFLLARKRLKDNLAALVIAFAYLSFFGVQNALSFDFHPIVLATTLLAWLFWFYEEKKWFGFWPVLLLFMGLQENFALTTVALGVYFFLKDKNWKVGLGTSLLGIVWFWIAVWVIIPHFRGEPFLYLPAHWEKLGWLGTLESLVYPWTKIQVIFFSFLAFGFLPLLAPATWILLFEEFFQRFVGSSSPNRWGLGFQYNIILAPILAMGAISVLERYFQNRKKLAVFLLVAGVFLAQVLTNPSLNQLRQREFYDFSGAGDIQVVLKMIPSEASVAATNNLVPHLSHRRQIILLTNCLENKTLWYEDMKRCYNLKPDYLVADFSPKGSLNNFYPDNNPEAIKRYFEQLQDSGEYQLMKQQGTIYLLKRIYN